MVEVGKHGSCQQLCESFDGVATTRRRGCAKRRAHRARRSRRRFGAIKASAWARSAARSAPSSKYTPEAQMGNSTQPGVTPHGVDRHGAVEQMFGNPGRIAEGRRRRLEQLRRGELGG